MTGSTEFLTLGFAGIDWIEHYLIHGPGDVQGQPVELDDEFAAFIVKAYQVNPRGERVVRRAFLSRAKGRSKSGLAAMVECFEAIGPCRFDHWAVAGEVSPWGYEYEEGEPVGAPLRYVECLNVATEEGQAGNTYDAVYFMLNPETCSKNLLRDYGRINVGLERTTLPNQRGFIEPITTKDTSKDGGKSTFIVADETHLWLLPRLKRLHGVMTRNLLKRKVASGWMLETSTMYGAGEDSVAEGTHAYAKQVQSGRKRDRTLLFDHKQAADKWDLAKKPERLKALREAYGPAAEWMNLDAIADSWDDPQVSEQDFRRYWLNQPVPTTIQTVEPSAVNADMWAQLEDDNPANAPERMVTFGVEVDPDRAWSSIGAAGDREDGRRHIELVDGKRQRGTSGVVPRAVALNESVDMEAVFVVDGGGPAKTLIEDLQNAGVYVLVASLADVAQADGDLIDGVNDGTFAHGPQEDLDNAVKGSRLRSVGDGVSVIGRRKSTDDVTPLKACSLAAWALDMATTNVW